MKAGPLKCFVCNSKSASSCAIASRCSERQVDRRCFLLHRQSACLQNCFHRRCRKGPLLHPPQTCPATANEGCSIQLHGRAESSVCGALTALRPAAVWRHSSAHKCVHGRLAVEPLLATSPNEPYGRHEDPPAGSAGPPPLALSAAPAPCCRPLLLIHPLAPIPPAAGRSEAPSSQPEARASACIFCLFRSLLLPSEQSIPRGGSSSTSPPAPRRPRCAAACRGGGTAGRRGGPAPASPRGTSAYVQAAERSLSEERMRRTCA